MSRRILLAATAMGAVFLSLIPARSAPGPAKKAEHSWASGDQWRVSVNVYNRGWMLDLSDPKQNRLKNTSRVQYEYHLTIRVAGVEEHDGRAHAKLEFIPDQNAPIHIAGERYLATIDMETLRVINAKRTQGSGTSGGALTTMNIDLRGESHSALFSRAYLPIDWVIARGDMSSAGVGCFLFRAPAKVGANGTWQRVDPANLQRETADTYRTEFRRTVTANADGDGVRVVVFRRDAFQDTPSYEVEQVWDPTIGWWRSFSRRIDGHIDLEATLLPE